ncbi:hypothetical protein KGF54_002325 [Candida jiufengensis]|uniref:uncharacterized protein n=1 Tax=Candida jiufengensis TaxID=497108 RepID=UPI0022257CD8|nr:uncharacterized protein KGF54_002325 [Candida jiufengensis]KAI5954550.1 hypothetical protein KGF54_002325 [Candida jiufengensis]
MNVTSNAYYTSQYLSEQQQQIKYKVPTPQDYFLEQNQKKLQNPFKIKVKNQQQPIMNNIRPKSSSTTTSPKNNSPTSINISSRPQEIEFEIDSDDQLEEEITPAQLNYISQNYIPKPKSQPINLQKPKKKINKNNNYYLNQKKDYDLADMSMKPKLYTHRTFREVFQDKSENLNKYNPMDSVFENSKNFHSYSNNLNEDEKDSSPTNNSKSTASKFFKTVKFMKDDYNDYNYYDHRTKKNAVKDIFVTENGSDDDDEDNNGITEVDENGLLVEGQEKKSKKNMKFKSMLKKRIRQAKKDLGKDFDSHVDNSKKVKTPQDDEPKELEAQPISKELVPINKGYLGTYVNPCMNYVWSWVDYYKQGKTSDLPPQQQPNNSKAFVKSSQQRGPKPKKFKKLTQSSKTLFTNWNEPANKMWNQKQIIARNQQPQSTHQHPHHNLSSSETLTAEDYPKEFIIEYDSNDEENYLSKNGSINEELYYNPLTKQLESQPPTSSSSMISLELPQQQRTLPIVNNSIEIVSSLITMIKKIQIMKLIFQPIDIIGEFFPNLQTIVIIIELVLFVWILFELSRLIDALCMMVKAFCAPMIAVGRFMNKIM